jgi:endonuclease YncB( thermonuclease family)
MAVPTFNPARAKVILPAPGKAETGDGDTMRLDLPFRLVSVDTPEKSNFGGKPAAAQQRPDAALGMLGELSGRGGVPQGFADYFAPRVAEGGALRHYAAAEEATRRLRSLRAEASADAKGKSRELAVIPAGEVVDGNGRMLAYVAPYLTKAERERLAVTSKKRRTFNLALVAEGWAASFPIWPSFPSRRTDLDAFLDAAGTAWRRGKGNWAGGNKAALLTGYEFRALIKIGRARLDGVTNADGTRRAVTARDALAAFERRCVDRAGVNHGRFGFIAVPHGDRLWTWTQKAAGELQDYLGG